MLYENDEHADITERIKATAEEFKRIEYHFENIPFLDITNDVFPQFKAFMRQYFEEPDKEYLAETENAESIKGNDKHWYRRFMANWRVCL